ncbi:hypothetical protein CANARDRAFT_28855 [[Candida] arabinofermentans NRRL YB-2248]|uniref:Pre-mRNA-splicing factor SYF1 n=1 Tax=[Candida] arabinofermentans NRRL YB-2248 TaxID=983967 RepID=A0A1E4SYZ8_9ASCO|nr:hypothetical protein CANARDRAFT_28855 [[Candida] arabinofermentans NRRL YB-2248]
MSPSNLLDYITDDDLVYEQAILKNPDELDPWLNYVKYKEGSSIESQFAVLNRAVNHLSRSYKLWMIYLRLRVSTVKSTEPTNSLDVHTVAKLFEKCLVTLDKFPVVWIEFLEFLLDYLPYFDVSYIRNTFNKALQSLTIIQHYQIWKLYLKFADTVGGQTSFVIYLRYSEFKLKLEDFQYYDQNEQHQLEEAIDYETLLHRLLETVTTPEQLDCIECLFDQLTKNSKFLVKLSISELELYVQYFDLLISIPKNDLQLAIYDEKIINFFNGIIIKFPDQLGKFIVKLANYWITRKEYIKAIEVFENGLSKANTMKDFTIIYDTYAEFEDSRLTKLANKVELLEKSTETNAELLSNMNMELEILFTRFENLMNRRKLLINDVLLRQNINNVQEWLNRITLYDEETELEKIIDCYVKAITSINPQRVPDPTDLLADLWIGYASIYEKNGDIQTARSIYNTASKVPFKNVDDLVKIWIEWTEMELRNDEFDQALVVIKKSVEIPKQVASKRVYYNDDELSPQLRIHKSTKLWNFYLDLVESSGELNSTCEVYDQIIRMKLATPLTILNYATFLQEHEHFEQSFKIYERGVSVFKYPSSYEIWNHYLTKMMEYQDKLSISVERIRDLFEQALEGCPKSLNKSLFLLYAHFEATKGSKSKSLQIYRKAIDNADNQTDMLELYKILLAKTAKLESIQATRPIYESALETLSVRTPGFIDIIIFGFVKVELSLKQLKRCREIFKYGSELVMKHSTKEEDREHIWELWKNFELENGSEITYKEMLRYRRHLENISKPILKTRGSTQVSDAAPVGFVASSEGPKVTTYTMGIDDDGSKSTKDADDLNNDQIELDLSDLE